MIGLLFWLFVLSAFGVILRYGGGTERKFAGFLLVCVALTLVVNEAVGLNAAYNYVSLIDAVIMIVALRLVATSDAYWPIWFAGFHLIVVASGAAYMLFPTPLVGLYGNAASFWALPGQAALALGAIADHKMRTLRQA